VVFFFGPGPYWHPENSKLLWILSMTCSMDINRRHRLYSNLTAIDGLGTSSRLHLEVLRLMDGNSRSPQVTIQLSNPELPKKYILLQFRTPSRQLEFFAYGWQFIPRRHQAATGRHTVTACYGFPPSGHQVRSCNGVMP
jgi:hypothetical protein